MHRMPRPKQTPDLDSELVWWPWGKKAGPADQPPRLSRPWRAIGLVTAQVLLIWGVLSLDRIIDAGFFEAGLLDRKPPPPLITSETISELRSRGLLIPVVGVEASQLRGSFGDPRGSRRHTGIDITAPRHRTIVAVEAGHISRITTGKLSGRAVFQLSADGHYSYFYAHLEAVADGLQVGDRVRAGQPIGTVGTSGNAKTPHLHFGIKRLDEPGRYGPGRAIDPFMVLRP